MLNVQELKEVAQSTADRHVVLKAVAPAFLILLAAWLSILVHRPSSPVASNAGESIFSSERAMEHVRAVAEKPRPIGSIQAANIRTYILQRFADLSIEAQVQEATAVGSTENNTTVGGTVHNIVARLHGTASTKTVLILGHYDSVHTSTGAGDDGSAVAAMLECARALKTAQLKNDIVFLLTDGEEVGLLGARSFVERHPWANDIGVVLNFEARGTSGPSMLFETSGTTSLVGGFAEVAPQPFASSAFKSIYDLLPNNTDFTVFRQRELAGLNFAFVEGLTHYHTMLDSVTNLDEASLQHQGEYMLSLARHLGNLNLPLSQDREAIYFNLFGSKMIMYPESWVAPLLVLASALLLGAMAIGFKNRRLTARGLIVGVLWVPLAMLAAAAATLITWRLILIALPILTAAPNAAPYNGWLFGIAFAGLSVLVTAILYGVLERRVSHWSIVAGSLTFLLLLAIVLARYVPGASYLATWPLIFSTGGFGLLLVRGDRGISSMKESIVITLFSIPAAILLSPFIYDLFVALAFSLTGAVGMMVALLTTLLAFHLSLLVRARKWLLPAVAAGVTVVFIAIGTLTSGSDSTRPAANTLAYMVDLDTQQAVWASSDSQPDEWTVQYLSESPAREQLRHFFPSLGWTFLTHQAGMAGYPPAVVEKRGDSVEEGQRTLSIKITPGSGASELLVCVGRDAKVTAASVNGEPVVLPEGGPTADSPYSWALDYYAPSPEGIELRITLAHPGPASVRVIQRWYRLPDTTDKQFTPRPAHIIAAPVTITDSSYVGATFEL